MFSVIQVSSAWSGSTEDLKNPLGWKVGLFQAGEKSQTFWKTVIKSIQLLFFHTSLLGINANIDKTITSWAEATRKGCKTNNSKETKDVKVYF